MFQGDPLSPLLFNLAINPLFVFLSKSEHCGYSAQLFAPHTTDLPPPGVPIYVFGLILLQTLLLVGTELMSPPIIVMVPVVYIMTTVI